MLFGRQDIQKGVEECRATPGALLVDVREAAEYRSGHIPGAVNVPLSEISQIRAERDRPLFLYCLRGSRSKRALGLLKKQGFTAAKSIGGIAAYQGRLER